MLTKLMTAEQIIGMAADEQLVFVGNHKPLKVKLNIYFKTTAYRGKYDENPLN